MKTKILTSVIVALLGIFPALAQDKTTVRANSSDISDNLDLRAVATIFGDSKDLEDFERRLNDPELQISNLDLNNDNYVDYLRVIETVEGNAHIIVIQAVLDKDLYQDIASVEVEKDRNNNVTVQVVGDVYMYGNNYIYEPVYVTRPVIYASFWIGNYRPYYSNWYWGYYPAYYTVWHPYPVFRYRNNVVLHINFGHTYHYVSTRRCTYAYNVYHVRRGNAYEVRYPNRSFAYRHSNYGNRYELDQHRTIKTRSAGSRELSTTGTRGGSSRNTYSSSGRNNAVASTEGNTATPRSYTQGRSNNSATRNSTGTSATRSNGRNYAENRSTGNHSSNNSVNRSSSSASNRSYNPGSNNSSNRNSTINSTRSSSSNRQNNASPSRSNNSNRQSEPSSNRNSNNSRGNSTRSGRA